MRFKTEPKPKGYKELKFFLRSGYPVNAYYVQSYSEVYSEIYGQDLTHVEFYGDTISSTSYRSWLGAFNEQIDPEKLIRSLAQELEDSELAEYPELLGRLAQSSMF
ncbi:MAG: hypothetical protein ACOCXP_02825 [Candidatus Dojkabacteria bacterium]